MDFYTSPQDLPPDQQQQQQSDLFEPISRPRSNTWPLPRPENTPTGSDYTPPPTLPEEDHLDHLDHDATTPGSGSGGPQQIDFITGAPIGSGSGGAGGAGGPGAGGLIGKKSTSRRNAWGNLSYADLITQAIQSSPENRLTLSQIYDWMVTNVTYFKDKGDSNSSAGWKNSIRHNLSLHNRFIRVQNEGTGKSSWWMLNPDAKPGKAARRRATSMETNKYEKKRGRIKKKLEAMRNGIVLSPASSLSEGLDLFPEEGGSQMSVQPNFSPSSDFRPRTSSNASSIGPCTNSGGGGRLSPVLDDSVQYYSGYFAPDRFGAEALAASLIPMKLSHEQSQVTSFNSEQFQQQQPPFRSNSFGVGTFTRPQTHMPSRPPPHSTSMDQLLFPSNTTYNPNPTSVQQAQQQLLFPDIKSDLDFNLEQLEPSFTECNAVDDEVLRNELLGNELIDFGPQFMDGGGPGGGAGNGHGHGGGGGTAAGTGAAQHQQQHQTFGQLQNTNLPNLYHHQPVGVVPQSLDQPQQQPQTQQHQQQQGRQWVH